MPIKSTAATWGSVTRTLHWLSALVIAFGLIHGYWMANFLPRAERIWHYRWHGTILMLFGVLLAVRILWRFIDAAPEQPAASTPLEKTAAHLGHLALYVLMIAAVISGYMCWSAFPARFDPARANQIAISVFGFDLPAMHVKADRAVFGFWEDTHTYLAWALAAFVVIHILAAMRHHFIKGNDVMRRMSRG